VSFDTKPLPAKLARPVFDRCVNDARRALAEAVLRRPDRTDEPRKKAS
jgi:hypothetical protein